MKNRNMLILIIIAAIIILSITTFGVVELTKDNNFQKKKNKTEIKNEEIIEKEYEENSICKPTKENQILESGSKYICKVNDNEEYNFYVLSIEDDKVNLILDSNICEDGTLVTKENQCNYPWHENTVSNTKGPDTAMKAVYNATKTWTNLPNMIMNYTDENNSGNEIYGYLKIETDKNTNETKIYTKKNEVSLTIGNQDSPLKARLPMQTELEYNGCKLYNGATCPAWLVENLRYWEVPEDKYSINKELGLDKTNGYWLLASSDKGSDNALHIHSSGYIIGYNTNDTNYGVRPVITLSKTNLR